MADSSVIVTISQTDKLDLASRTGKDVLVRLRNHVDGLMLGSKRASSVKVFADGAALAAASGTLTCASTVATNTFAINGVTFTGVASGATSAQFNIDFTDDGTAANIAAAINASTNALVQYLVTATSSAEVVTITAAQSGVAGNCITLAGTDTTLEASGARLTGGTGGNVTPTTVTL